MPEVLLTFTNLSWQKGSAAQVISLVSLLRAFRADLSFTLLSHYTGLDEGPAAQLGIQVAGYPLTATTSATRRSIHFLLARMGIVLAGGLIRASRLFANWRSPVFDAYARADLVLDLSGDSYRDRPGGVALAHSANFLACRSLGLRYALISQSIGPFAAHSRRLARHCLDRAQFVHIRDAGSLETLRELGVQRPVIHLAPDVAFHLPLCAPARVREILEDEGIEAAARSAPLVGLSVSAVMEAISERGRHGYVEQLVRLARHIHNSTGAFLVLVPYQIVPRALGWDDVATALELRRRLGNPAWVHAVEANYNPCELQSVISRCNAFLASRMHACIAALSSGVPTVALSWGHKYEGLMEQAGMAKYVWRLQDPRRPELCELFDALWRERAAVRDRVQLFGIRARNEVSRTIELLAASIPREISGSRKPQSD